MRPRALAILMCLTLTVVCGPALGQTQIPEQSLTALQETFGTVRDTLWRLNDDFWHQGDYERCIAMMRLITQIDPHDVDAYGDGAWLMQNQHRDNEAEAFLREGLANNLDVFDIYFELGHFCHRHGRLDEAISYLETAASFGTWDISWHVLAHAYEAAGYPDDALNIWLRLESLEPDSPVPNIQIDRIMRGEPAH